MTTKKVYTKATATNPISNLSINFRATTLSSLAVYQEQLQEALGGPVSRSTAISSLVATAVREGIIKSTVGDHGSQEA